MYKPKNWIPEEETELIEMYNVGFTYKQIGEKLGRSLDSVGHRIRKLIKNGTLKHRYPNRIKNQYEYDLSNLEKLTPEGVYFIVSILGDGSLYNKENRRNVHFCYRGRDVLDFRSIYSQILKTKVNISWRKKKSKDDYKRDYGGYLQLYDKKLVEMLNNRFKIPIGKKSGIIRIPKQILESNNPKIHGAVLRSAYETEGGTDIDNNSPSIVIGNTSKEFLKELSVICNKYAIENSIYKIRIVIRDLESIINYYQMAYIVYNFPHHVIAKKRAFEDLINHKLSMG